MLRLVMDGEAKLSSEMIVPGYQLWLNLILIFFLFVCLYVHGFLYTHGFAT